jgi:hypothetical protein
MTLALTPRIARPSGGTLIGNPAIITIAAALTVVGLRLWTIPEATDGTPGVCFVRTCTGTACPGCGLTRAVAYLLRGDLAAMWAMHPLAPLFVADAVAIVFLVWATRRGWFSLRPTHVAVWAGIHVPLLLGVWVIRLSLDTLPV